MIRLKKLEPAVSQELRPTLIASENEFCNIMHKSVNSRANDESLRYSGKLRYVLLAIV